MWKRLWRSALAPLIAGLIAGHPLTAAAASVEVSHTIRAMMTSTAQLIVLREGGARRTGSSVVLDVDPEADRLLLLTAAHVVTPIVPQEVSVVTPLRHGELPARVVAFDDEADLALVETSLLQLEPVSLGHEAMLGDEVLVVAFPWGRRATLVRGIVSQIVWHEPENLVEIPLVGSVALIDATVSYGMSGGGVFSRDDGTLLGIVRGYRSAQVALPGSPGQAVSFPLPGETTVVSTRRIACFLAASSHADLVPEPFRAGLDGTMCDGDR